MTKSYVNVLYHDQINSLLVTVVRNAAIAIAIRLRYDYDPTTTYRARLLPFDTIRREQKMNMSLFRRSRT